MGVSSLRRHRGGYVDRQLTPAPEPTAEELLASLNAERGRVAELEAQLAAMQKPIDNEALKTAADKLPPDLRASVGQAFEQLDAVYRENAKAAAEAHAAELEALRAAHAQELEALKQAAVVELVEANAGTPPPVAPAPTEEPPAADPPAPADPPPAATKPETPSARKRGGAGG